MKRRDFLASALAFSQASYVLQTQAQSERSTQTVNEEAIRAYLRSIMPSLERIDQFTHRWSPEESMRLGNGWTYDAELGWVHAAAVHANGVDGSRTFYHYEQDGARRVTNCRDQACRIHAYGNSFTHCDQVNDNETWEEYLAAHLQEPIRNYGVGGYGVYQAYRRMRIVEQRNPAEYIIFNIWDDDHFRSLDAWRSIRFGQGSNCGFTLPHVRVDVNKNQCVEVENLLQTPEEVSKLRDEDFVYNAFKEDPILQLVLAARSNKAVMPELLQPVSVSFGIPEEKIADRELAKRLREIHTEAALYATKQILTWCEQFAAEAGKKLLLVLSFSQANVVRELQGKTRFDQKFCDWLQTQSFPVLDMRDCFAKHYQKYDGDFNSFLKPFYNGHHTPQGNFFTAWEMKDPIVSWLDPAPAPYS